MSRIGIMRMREIQQGYSSYRTELAWRSLNRMILSLKNSFE